MSNTINGLYLVSTSFNPNNGNSLSDIDTKLIKTAERKMFRRTEDVLAREAGRIWYTMTTQNGEAKSDPNRDYFGALEDVKDALTEYILQDMGVE